MTTIASNPETAKPPERKLSPAEWLRQNLFDSWFNTILTLLSVAIVVWVVWGFWHWAFDEQTRWGVISANFKLFASGTYPADQLWRVWLVFGLVMAVLGIAGGAWQGLLMVYVACTGGFLGLLAFVPFGAAQPLLAAVCGATFAGLILGWKRSWLQIASLASWLAVLPLVFLILVSGLWGLQPLNTQVITGLLLTLILAAASLVSAFPIGVLLALGRNNDDLPVVKWFCTLAIELIRGIPLTILLFAAWLMVPIFLAGISVDLLIRAIIGFILFTAVYVAEDIRGGLQSISRGQVEAARALGLNPFQITMLVILPQALRAALPAIVNEFLTLFKDTSLVFIVGMVELLGATRLVYNQPEWLGTQQEALVFAAIIYFVFCYGMAFAAKRVEQSLSLGER
ncbi:amino acid ABC transporter permease [Synechococcus sp. PCC 7336]|uniref:amino acid ABC transporter permease n=1 Tax=Synechococcus sp. PCC 7336 TaxID=195250 RepID=UPI000346EEE8|nr:amino acid ABC transporter permease [Synechococcus sp. PCC 7336]